MSRAELAEEHSGGQELKAQHGWLLLARPPGPWQVAEGGHPKPEERLYPMCWGPELGFPR